MRGLSVYVPDGDAGSVVATTPLSVLPVPFINTATTSLPNTVVVANEYAPVLELHVVVATVPPLTLRLMFAVFVTPPSHFGHTVPPELSNTLPEIVTVITTNVQLLLPVESLFVPFDAEILFPPEASESPASTYETDCVPETSRSQVPESPRK